MSSKKTALVTGANKGIGLETARQLGQKGITVLVGARDDAKARRAAEKLRKEGIDAHGVVIDVNDAASIEKAAAQIERDYGRLDILVNNAGDAPAPPHKRRRADRESVQHSWVDPTARYAGFAHLRYENGGLQRLEVGRERLHGSARL